MGLRVCSWIKDAGLVHLGRSHLRGGTFCGEEGCGGLFLPTLSTFALSSKESFASRRQSRRLRDRAVPVSTIPPLGSRNPHPRLHLSNIFTVFAKV